MKALLDTCVCIEVLRGRPPRMPLAWAQCRSSETGVSSITVAELEYGAARSRDPAASRRAVGLLVERLSVLPFDAAAAQRYGELRAELERGGVPIGPLDMLIAAHALSLDVPLITANSKEFRRVRGLRVENWY